MDRKCKRHGRESGHSYFLERKEQVSIEGRGNVLIRNTQTQVRELYRRHVPIEPEEPSSSQGDVKILETSRRVRTLNKKIEDEIDKLKRFRDMFLQEQQARNVKQAKKLQSQSKKTLGNLAHKETPVAISQPEAKTAQFSSPNSGKAIPYFRTVHVASIPISGAVDKRDPNGTILKQVPPNSKTPKPAPPRKDTRMGGGCTFGYNDCVTMPCSVYQCDYEQSPTIACQCSPYHCYPGAAGCRCYEYHAPMSLPCSHNPCYQYPMGAVYHQQVPSCYARPCPCPAPTASRRTTDLNTEEYCRNLPPSPRETGRRTRSPSPTGKRRKKKKSSPRYPSAATPKNDTKIMKVSLKKTLTKRSKKQSAKSAEEEVITKAEKPDSDGDFEEQEKLRLHRQYMEMYKQEHEKTAKKESSPTNSDLDTHPTYTKLTDEAPELKSSSKDSEIKAEPVTIVEICEEEQKQDSSSSAEEDVLEQPPPIREQPPTDAHRRRVQIQDTFQKCTLSVKHQAVRGSMGLCQAAEVEQECVQYAVCASGSQVKLSSSKQSFQQSLHQSSHQSCHPCCHQSCQTMTDFGYQTCRKEVLTQTDQLASAPGMAPQRDLRTVTPWNRNLSSGIRRRRMKETSSDDEREDSSEMSTQCVCVTETMESIEVTLAAEPPPSVDRRHQSEPYIRSMSAVFGHDDPLSSATGHQSVSLQFGSRYEEPSAHNMRRVHFSSPKTSATDELFSFPEHTQLSLMSESPRERSRERKNLSRWTLNRSEEDSPASDRTYNRSEQSSPTFSLQLDSPSVHNSTSASYRTFNRSEGEESSPDLSLQLDSTSKHVYNSSNASYKTFCQSELQSSPEFSLRLDSPTDRQNSSSPFASSRTCNRTNQNSPQHTYNKDLDSRISLAATCEKRTRSVKFQDDSGSHRRIHKMKSSRSTINWERSLSTDGEVEDANSSDNLCGKCLSEDSSHLIDSCRSSSTAEFTCNESNYEEDYLSCTESKTEHVPPFRGCPCMRNHYMTLAALSRPISRYAQ